MSDHAFSIVPEPDVIATDLKEEVLLLDPRNGEMFVLNCTARSVWLSLPCASLARPAAALCAEFDVSESQARRDAARLLRELRSANLVSIQRQSTEVE